jgi:F-type H+-transporting ATPase subunit epsilon
MPLSLQVVTPERELTVADDVTFVLAHGVDGDQGILPGRAPMLIALGVGELKIERGDITERMLVDGGFLQVKDDNVIVLAEYAVLPSEVDATVLSSEIEDLKRRLQGEVESAELKRELARREGLVKLLQVG